MSNGIVSSFISGRGAALQHAALKRQQEQAQRESPYRTRAMERQEQQDLYQAPFKKRALQFQESQMNLQQQKNKAEFKRFTERNNLESMVQAAAQFSNITDPSEQDAFLVKRIKDINARGGDSSDTIALLKTPIEQRGQAVKNVLDIGAKYGIIKPSAIEKPKKFDKPIVGVDEKGNKAFFRQDTSGNLVKVPGAVPPPTSQEIIRVTQDGTFERITGAGVSEQKLSKKIVTNLQEKIIANENNLASLDRIGSQFMPEFLTYGGMYSATKAKIKSKAGFKLDPKEKDFLGKRRQFTQNINQFFNAYRKEITGAAASIQELDSLKKAMLNENLAPDEFKPAFDEFRNGILRSNRLSRRILREGLKGQFGKNLDRLFIAGEDDSVESRGKELRLEGYTNDQIGKMLSDEGY